MFLFMFIIPNVRLLSYLSLHIGYLLARMGVRGPPDLW